MTNQQWLSLCNAGDVSDYGESLELLPDTVGRSLATRIRLLLARADRESRLAVRLRQELHDIAGSDVASAITVAERPQPQEEQGETFPRTVTAELKWVSPQYAGELIAEIGRLRAPGRCPNGHATRTIWYCPTCEVNFPPLGSPTP